jgi:dephospho-CoA kinase
VGLTGGIASGKTTVAGFLAEMGAFVQDGDRIAHEILEPGGAAYDGVIECFGPSILDRERRILREHLGKLVFEDSEARRSLEAIVHPLIRKEAEARLERYLETGHATIAVFDAALLVETGAHHDHHRLIVVRCSAETQLQRLLARGGLDPAKAEARIRAQASLEDKLALADYVIDTETTLRVTRTQTKQVYGALIDDYEARFGNGAGPSPAP